MNPTPGQYFFINQGCLGVDGMDDQEEMQITDVSSRTALLKGAFLLTEKLLVEPEPGNYYFINQGCLTVDNMDDQEELRCTDVCWNGLA